MPIEVEELINKRLKELAESGKRCDLILPNLYTLEENQRNRRKPMYRELLEYMQAQQEAVCNVQSFLESYIDLCRRRKVNSDYAKKVAAEEVLNIEILLEDLKRRGQWKQHLNEQVLKMLEGI